MSRFLVIGVLLLHGCLGSHGEIDRCDNSTVGQPCDAQNTTICRWEYDQSAAEGAQIYKRCFTTEEIDQMNGAVTVFSTDCRSEMLVVKKVNSPSSISLIQFMECDEQRNCTGNLRCALAQLPFGMAGYCCGDFEEMHKERSIREPRAVKSKRKNKKKAEEPEITTVGQLTTTTKEPTDCRRLFATHDQKKEFENPIASVKLVKRISVGYKAKKDCKKDSYGFRGNRFFVRDCKAIFRICLEEPQTTAPLTTAPTRECKKIISLHGVDTEVDGTIESVEFKPLPPYPGYGGGYGDIHDQHCYKDVDYSYDASRLWAAPSCKGIFVVCYGPKQTTAAPFTTTVAEPVCEKVTSGGHTKGEVDGVIVSMVLLKQIITGYSFYSKLCESGPNYGFDDSKYYVKDCKGVFKVCYEDRPKTEPLTTTPKTESCRKVYNNHGVKKTFEGDITSVTYIVLDKKGANTRFYCREGYDYTYAGPDFTASSSCKGLFKICYRPEVPAFTVAPREIFCKQVYSKKNLLKKFDGSIVSFELIKQIVVGYGYGFAGYGDTGVCEKGVNYYMESKDIFRVKNCWGLFKVCYEEPRPTTTIPPFTTSTEQPVVTTTESEKCERIYNVYGLKLDFGKEIKRVIFIEVRGAERSGYMKADFAAGAMDGGHGGHGVRGRHPRSLGGYGGYQPQVVCREGKDYSYTGSVLTASAYCRGYFYVCVKEDVEKFTTLPPEPECKTFKVDGRARKVFDGQVIRSVHVQRQYGHHGHGYCIKGPGYTYRGNTLIVRNCRGEFKVCLEQQPPTTIAPTTVPPLTTSDTNICKRVFNQYGIKQYFHGEIVSVVYLQVKQPKQPKQRGGYGGYGIQHDTEDLCHLGQGFNYDGHFFYSTPYCPGFFYICYKNDLSPFYHE